MLLPTLNSNYKTICTNRVPSSPLTRLRFLIYRPQRSYRTFSQPLASPTQRWASKHQEGPRTPGHDDLRFANEKKWRKKVEWREDIKVMLAVLALLAATGAFIEAERVKMVLQKRMDQIKDRLLRRSDIRDIGLRWVEDMVTDPVTIQKVDGIIKQLVAQHMGAVREGLIDGLMKDPEFIDAVIDWSKEQAM